MYHTKYFYRKQITDFLENLKRDVFKTEYLEYHKHKIDALNWLLSYYSDTASCTPKQLLESYIDKMRIPDNLRSDLEWIKILYYWINYKKIKGF